MGKGLPVRKIDKALEEYVKASGMTLERFEMMSIMPIDYPIFYKGKFPAKISGYYNNFFSRQITGSINIGDITMKISRHYTGFTLTVKYHNEIINKCDAFKFSKVPWTVGEGEEKVSFSEIGSKVEKEILHYLENDHKEIIADLKESRKEMLARKKKESKEKELRLLNR